jgi:hypothetical protein
MIKNMKLKLYTATALVALVAFASCAGDDKKEYVDKSIMPTAEEKAAAAQNAVSNPAIQNTNAVPANLQQPGMQLPANPQQPGSTITMPGGQTVTVPSGGPIAITPNVAPQSNVVMTQNPSVVQPTAPGMNPPHGQPGHRCDISVGAPLNSKPAAPATTTGTTVPAQPQVTMTEVPTKVKTLPGMNPPHGEPGHRCDIAVGAPLNSKPATPTTVTTAPASIAPPPLLTAPKTDSSKN